MAFHSGPVSFRRFNVLGDAPKLADQAILDKLNALALRPGEIGIPDELEYGWGGGAHVLDGTFSLEHNVFANCILFGLRVDTNKMPGALKKAYAIQEEQAVAKGNPSGFITKAQKRDVKVVIARRVDEEKR